LTLSEFDLLSAQSVAEASSLLRRYGADARVCAGGTDLLVKMKHKRIAARYLIDIKSIPGLDAIRYDERDGLRIGALASIQAIKDSPLIARHYPLLRQAAAGMGTLHIRNLGTLGGNLANASPSAEFAPALLVLDASVRCASLDGERTIALADFFVGPSTSALAADEILTEVHVPPMPARAAGVYLKQSLRRMDVAIASAAVLVCLEANVIREARIALGAVAPTPFRVPGCEQALAGKELQAGLIEHVAKLASERAAPIDDLRSDRSYRRKAVAMLVEQGLEQAVRLAAGGRPTAKRAEAAA
jgi:carbon-monoxide dehydrogenase medium subunit